MLYYNPSLPLFLPILLPCLFPCPFSPFPAPAPALASAGGSPAEPAWYPGGGGGGGQVPAGDPAHPADPDCGRLHPHNGSVRVSSSSITSMENGKDFILINRNYKMLMILKLKARNLIMPSHSRLGRNSFTNELNHLVLQ